MKNIAFQIFWGLNYSNWCFKRYAMFFDFDSDGKNQNGNDRNSKKQRVIQVSSMPLPFLAVIDVIKVSSTECQILSFFQGRSNQCKVCAQKNYRPFHNFTQQIIVHFSHTFPNNNKEEFCDCNRQCHQYPIPNKGFFYQNVKMTNEKGKGSKPDPNISNSATDNAVICTLQI